MPQILDKGANGTELLVTSTTAITSYNPDTGSRNWEWSWTWPPMMKPLRTTIGLPLEVGGMLYACGGDGGGNGFMVALNLPTSQGAKPTQAWENAKQFPYVPGLLSRGDHLYFVNDLGYAGCFEGQVGQAGLVRAGRKIDGFTSSPLLVEEKKIYAASEEGEVLVLAADTKFKILARPTKSASACGRRRRSPMAGSSSWVQSPVLLRQKKIDHEGTHAQCPPSAANRSATSCGAVHLPGRSRPAGRLRQPSAGGAAAQAENLTRAGELGEAVWAYLEVLETEPDNAAARQTDRPRRDRGAHVPNGSTPARRQMAGCCRRLASKPGSRAYRCVGLVLALAASSPG